MKSPRKFLSDHGAVIFYICFFCSIAAFVVILLHILIGPAPYVTIRAYTKLDIDNYLNNPNTTKTNDKLVITLVPPLTSSYSNLTLKINSKYLDIKYEKDKYGHFVNENFDLSDHSKEFEFDLNYSNFPSTLKNDYIIIELIDNEKNTRKTKSIDYYFGKIRWLDSLKLFWCNLGIGPKIKYPVVSTRQIYISLGILIVAILSLLFGSGILRRKKK